MKDKPLFGKFGYQIVRFQNVSNKVAIELQVLQFWSEAVLWNSNQTRAAHSFDFEIRCMIPDQIALHSVQLPLLIRLQNNLPCIQPVNLT